MEIIVLAIILQAGAEPEVNVYHQKAKKQTLNALRLCPE